MLKHMQKPVDIFWHSCLSSIFSIFIFIGLTILEDTHGVSDAGFGILYTPVVLAASFATSMVLVNVVSWIQKRLSFTSKYPALLAAYVPPALIFIASILEYQRVT
jgi:hypothetical protein